MEECSGFEKVSLSNRGAILCIFYNLCNTFVKKIKIKK